MKNNTEKTITFEAHSLSVDNVSFPAEYLISPGGTVFALVSMQDNGKTSDVRIKITPDHAQYTQALEAAQQGKALAADPTPEPAPADLEPVPDEEPEAPAVVSAPAPEAPAVVYAYYTLRRPPMPGGIPHGADSVEELPEPLQIPGHGTAHGIARYTRELTGKEITDHELLDVSKAVEILAADPTPETVPTNPEPAAVPEAQANESKKACGSLPAKPFIGQTIQGETWKIYFDGDKGRTRVIFTDKPNERAREAVQAAGFYWSPVMESWNKKLTFKAYRAAQALALQLRELCA